MELIDAAFERSIDFEYYESIAQVFTGDVVDDHWLELPNYVIGQLRGGWIHLEVAGRPPLRVEDGEAYVIPANLSHRYWIHNLGRMRISNAHILYRILGNFDLLGWFEHPLSIAGADADRIGSLCRQMVELARSPAAASIPALVRKKALGLELLSTILERSRLRPTAERLLGESSRLRPALDHIQAHLSEPIARKTLARLACLSEPRFHAVFKKALGHAPLDYVKRLRLSKAQSLLIETELAVGEVGEASGYGDPYHFSRSFKSALGVSPTEYRRLGRERRQRLLA